MHEEDGKAKKEDPPSLSVCKGSHGIQSFLGKKATFSNGLPL